MSKIYNSITYTTAAPQYGNGTREEGNTALIRPYKLTEKGAERILRRQGDYNNLVVIRVEAMQYASR